MENRDAVLGLFSWSGGPALPCSFGEARADKLDQFLRRNRFCPEGYIETFILGYGFSQSAQHDDRKPIIFPANLANQFRAAAIRHEVIGNDHAEAVAEGLQYGQRTFGTGCNRHLEPCLPQNCFADTELKRIVVNEQNLAQSSYAS